MHAWLRHTSIAVVVAIGAAAGLTRVPTHAVMSTTQRDPVYAGMVGQWQGTMEVRDRLDAKHRVRMPAKVRVQPIPESDALELHVTARGETGAEFLDINRLLLNKGLTTAQWGNVRDSMPQRFDVRVNEITSPRAPLQIVLEGERSIDELPSTIRQTVTIAPGEIKILEETRAFGGEFEFSRSYVLRRVA